MTPTLGLPHGPFHDIDLLHRGARIIVRMPYGRYVYRVRGHKVVRANAWSAFVPGSAATFCCWLRATLQGRPRTATSCEPSCNSSPRFRTEEAYCLIYGGEPALWARH